MFPEYNTRFEIKFGNNRVAHALHIQKGTAPETIAGLLTLPLPAASIFLTGGAGGMSPEDIQRTREMIDVVAKFAGEKELVIVDGGTTSGIMQMMGDAREKYGLKFPLIGVAPTRKISYPGHQNPDAEAQLEEHHTHFVLIDGDAWGDESEVILGLTRAIAGGKHPALGILINGGQIARQEVYLAATKQFRMPMIILEGSGRAADEIATAFKTGRANQRILQAILAGGDIQLINTLEGPDAMRAKLLSRFTA